MDEFQPIVDDAALEHLVEVAAGDLRFRPEDGITAAHICHDRVAASLRVTQRDLVLFARVPAVQIARAVR